MEFKRIKSGFIVIFQRNIVPIKIEKWGENEKKILELIDKDNTITISQIAKKLKIGTTAVENNILKLKQKGVLKRIGPDKGGYWNVVK